MKKKKLKAWVQDIILISLIGKMGFLFIAAEIMFKSPVTLFIFIYSVVTMAIEITVLNQYSVRPSLLVGKEL